jgi:hypothetical protein
LALLTSSLCAALSLTLPLTQLTSLSTLALSVTPLATLTLPATSLLALSPLLLLGER